MGFNSAFKGLNAELNPICHLLAIQGGATIVVVSKLRVNVYHIQEMEWVEFNVYHICPYLTL
jgi:hypothetical protein